MLQLQDISLRRGVRTLFEHASFQVHDGQRLGVVGANGCGKSSLFAMILGHLEADHGELQLNRQQLISHVAQEMPATSASALNYVIDGDRELREIQRHIEASQNAGQEQRLHALYDRLEAIDGYGAEHKAARLLHGLGFSHEETQQAVREFSGGWRMRLNLAQALMCRSDILLLDEPTNHLDLPAIVWLERWLKAYAGILLIISHDRDFLDSMCTQIAHIEHQQLTVYNGNYSRFEGLRAEQLAQRQALFQKQQSEIKHIQQFVDRFRAKASKARQAQSRLKTLERMALIAPAHADSPFHFQFFAPRRLPNQLLKLTDGVAGYDQVVLSKIQLNINAGDRIGLLGMNGAGKSTLMKTIADGSTLLAGERLPVKDCHIGYFAQHQLEQLNPEASPYDHMHTQDKSLSEQDVRNYLGGFDFQGDRIFEPVAPFSGGEKARLVLALIIQQRPNLLLLDEPTNHLDLEMRQALSLALQDYTGALVVIAHDRHLMRSVCDELYLVHDGLCAPFKGDLDDYPAWLLEQEKQTQRNNQESTGNQPADNDSSASKKARRQQEAQRRQQLKPFTQRVRRAEQHIENIRGSLTEVEYRLSEQKLYADASRKEELAGYIKHQAQLKEALTAAECEWMEATEALEMQEEALNE